MSKTYAIREFETKDYGALMYVWEETGIGSKARGDDLGIIEQTLRLGGKLWVAELPDSDKVVGTAWLTYDGRRLHLHHIGVLPEYRRRGIGSDLTKKAISYAKKQQMQIKLEVHASNKDAIAIYERLGFNRLGDYDIYIIRSFESMGGNVF
ncbi:MAG: GNAT family N-acetyltransferase [Bacteroidota bacterium]